MAISITADKLLDCMSFIDDFFITEAETADVTTAKAKKRKRIVKYSVAGIAVSVGLAVAYWRFGAGRFAKAA